MARKYVVKRIVQGTTLYWTGPNTPASVLSPPGTTWSAELPDAEMYDTEVLANSAIGTYQGTGRDEFIVEEVDV